MLAALRVSSWGARTDDACSRYRSAFDTTLFHVHTLMYPVFALTSLASMALQHHLAMLAI